MRTAYGDDIKLVTSNGKVNLVINTSYGYFLKGDLDKHKHEYSRILTRTLSEDGWGLFQGNHNDPIEFAMEGDIYFEVKFKQSLIPPSAKSTKEESVEYLNILCSRIEAVKTAQSNLSKTKDGTVQPTWKEVG